MQHPENDKQYKGLVVNEGVQNLPQVNPYATFRRQKRELTAEEYKCVSGVNESVTTNNYSLTYMADDGTSVTKKFARVEQTPRGKLLMNSLLSDIETMGHSISEQEKRQILMEVLKKLC